VDLEGRDGPVNATVEWEESDGTTGSADRSWELSGTWSGIGLLGAVDGLGVGSTVGSLLTLVVMGLVIGYASPRMPPIAAAGAGVGVAGGGMLIGWLPSALFAVIMAAYVVLVLSEVQT
jgi:hypothetical protein